MKAKINGIQVYAVDCQGVLIENWRMKNHTNHWSPHVTVYRGSDYVTNDDGANEWTGDGKTFYRVTLSSLIRCQRAQIEIAKRHARRVFEPKKAAQ